VVIDGRTDIYYAGRPLLRGAHPQPASKQGTTGDPAQARHEEPAKPERSTPRGPPTWRTILLKAMSKEPSGRYDTARRWPMRYDGNGAKRPIRARRSLALFDRTTPSGREGTTRVVLRAGATVLFLILAWSCWVLAKLRSRKGRQRADEGRRRNGPRQSAKGAARSRGRMLTSVAGTGRIPAHGEGAGVPVVDALEFYQKSQGATAPTPTEHETTLAYIKSGRFNISGSRRKFGGSPAARTFALGEDSVNSPGVQSPGRTSPSPRRVGPGCSREGG